MNREDLKRLTNPAINTMVKKISFTNLSSRKQ
jgi:hypothetical protein